MNKGELKKIVILSELTKLNDKLVGFNAIKEIIDSGIDAVVLNKNPAVASFSNRGITLFAGVLFNRAKKSRGTMTEEEDRKFSEEWDKKTDYLVYRCYPFYKWSFEKNYFHFNERLSESLIEQANDQFIEKNDIPVEIFKNIPVQCGFVSIENRAWESTKGERTWRKYSGRLIDIMGFFFWIENNPDDSGKFLTIVPAVDVGDDVFFHHINLYFPKNSGATIKEAYKNSDNVSDKNNRKTIHPEEVVWLNVAIQHLLFLCCSEADYKKNYEYSRIIEESETEISAIDDVNIWEVGQRIKKQIVTSTDDKSPLIKSRTIRRARFQHYWERKKGSSELVPVLHWLLPTFVNIKYRAWSELGEETIKAEEREDHLLETQLAKATFNGELLEIKDEPIEFEKTPRTTAVSVYPRNRKVAINALRIAEFKCEYDSEHVTFIRKRSRLPYVEPHHLVPLAFQDAFNVSLDREQNIVCLCSNCHREIHYGIDSKKMIKKLYKKKKSSLEKIGVYISYEELLQMYK